MPGSDIPPPPGPLASARAMLGVVLGLARNRVELFAVEFEEESLRAIDLLLRLAVWLGAMLLAFVTGTAAVAAAFWSTSPVLVLGLLTLGYGLAAAWCWRDLQRRLAARPRPFAGTVAEFERDCQCLQPNDSNPLRGENSSSSPRPSSSGT
jgi:uncharacterized membrane protein YqjE